MGGKGGRGAGGRGKPYPFSDQDSDLFEYRKRVPDTYVQLTSHYKERRI